MMYRIAFMLAAVLAAAAAGRSPNADLIEELMKTGELQGSRYSNNIIEDALLDVPGLISKYGYPSEVHHVITEDGYVLEAHRIPHGRDQNNEPIRGRPVVFLMHGLMSSSADFLVIGPGSALGYLLAEAGYDVWLGNARGNYYSRRNIHLDPNDRSTSDFWRFSWEQIGMYDVPALVDYILATTGQQRMHYIGHSQGGTAFLVMNSMRPEYNDKFISFQGLAPAAYFENTENSMYHLLAPYERLIDQVAFGLGIAELLPNSPLTTALGIALCSEEATFQPICASLVLSNFGSEGNLNATLIPIFLGHAPAGASVRQWIHYGQTIHRGVFARYYFDPDTNLRLYGNINPPEFDMSKVTVPSYLHYGLADTSTHWRDIHLLAERLENAVLIRAERETFGHIDFIWAKHVKAEIYDTLLEKMRSAE